MAAPASTPDDAASAQAKLVRLVRGTARDPIILSEAEVNAFVMRNLDPRESPFDRPAVFLRTGDVVELVGQVPLGRVLAESPLAVLRGVVPDEWEARRLWLTLAAHVKLERRPRPQLRLEIRRVTVGRQRVPTVALRLFFEPASLGFVRVSVPETVHGVRVESGRAIIHPPSSRERT